MTEQWRFVDLGAVDPHGNQALMSVLSRSAAERATPILQTSVWGTTHLNVGWFDDVDATLDLDECERLGVQVVRRPLAGGGTAYYEAGCAALWGLMLPAAPGAGDLDALAGRMQAITRGALDRLGLEEVRFEGSADLRLPNGRKLGGISANDFGRVLSAGGFLNLSPPDLDLYLRVARVPEGKFDDKLVKDLREYVCTASEVAGRPVPYSAVRDALVDATRSSGVGLVDQPLDETERAALVKVRDRVAGGDSVRRVSSIRFREEHEAPGTTVGFGNHKGRKLCRAGVALRGGVVAAAMLAGDMHVAPPDTLDRAAHALTGAPAGDAHELRARLASVFEGDDVHQADETTGVTTEDLLRAVERAVEAAQSAPTTTGARR